MWQRIKTFFKGSETIAWALLQTALGFAVSVLTFVDPQLLAPVLPPKWFPVFLLANGLATEYLRRRRASDLK